MPNVNSRSTQPSTFVQFSEYYDNSKKVMVTSETSRASVASRRYEVRQSVNTPGYSNPNRKGVLLANDFLYTLEKDIAPYGSSIDASPFTVRPGQPGYSYSRQSGVSSTTGTWDGYQNTDNPFAYPRSYFNTRPDEDVLDGQARNAVLTKIKGTNVNVAVATAEAGKTLDMVGNAAMKIAGAMRDLRRGNFVNAARNLGVASRKRSASRFKRDFAKDQTKAVASGWLALQYGWLPLLNDVYGSVKELNGAANQGMVSKVKVKKSKTTDIRFAKPSTYSSKTSLLKQEGYAQTDVTYSVTFIRRHGAQQDLPRLGITNPALVAWELVPYSFVVDWFLPIGSYLENLDATLGCEFLTGSRTVFYRMQVVESDIMYDKLSLSSRSKQSSRTVVYCKRTRLTGFPTIALPSFKNPASVGHVANGLALLVNLFKK